MREGDGDAKKGVLDMLRDGVSFGTRQTCKRRTGWLYINQTGVRLKIAGKHLN